MCCPRKTCLEHKNNPRIGFHGKYFRSSDSKYIKRWICLTCKRTFSQATSNPCFAQKKRRINSKVRDYLESGVAMRQIARKLRIHRITVARKRKFWSEQGFLKHPLLLKKIKPQECHFVQFDDLETFEHTKCKPLSVSIAVTNKRHILDFKVSRMSARGRLAEKSREKYGLRADERPQGWDTIFRRLSSQLKKDVVIISDKNPHYPKAIKLHFPNSIHRAVKGRKVAEIGQGELKVGGFDPLFQVNHTFAKLRDLIKPLTKKSWCTVKCKRALIEHLNIYVSYHNRQLLGYSN